MTSKLLGISMAALFVLTMTTAPLALATSDYLDIVKGKVIEKKNNVVLKIKVAGNISDGINPVTNEGFFGYAALTSDGTGLLAVTYHEPIVDSSAQPGWHAHVVDLNTATTGCASGIGVGSASLDEPGHTVVTKNTVVVNQVSPNDVGDFTGTLVSFNLTVEGGEVCINLTDVF